MALGQPLRYYFHHLPPQGQINTPRGVRFLGTRSRLPRNRMIRCYLRGSMGDALRAIALGYSVSCAAGYNIRWLIRAIMRLGLRGLFALGFLA